MTIFAQFFQHYQIMGKFTEFKLTLQSLPAGKHRQEFHLGKEFFVNMENTDIRDADLNVVLDIDHNHGVYDMTFTITGTVTLLCDRCLDNLVMDIDTAYHIIVEYGDAYNDESDDILIIPRSDSSLNVAYMIYDTVALAIPIKHVHTLGKCNRAMSSLLRKHRAASPDDPDAEMEETLLDEIDDADVKDETTVDPRWDELKKLTDNN